jgi:hypothetical protein
MDLRHPERRREMRHLIQVAFAAIVFFDVMALLITVIWHLPGLLAFAFGAAGALGALTWLDKK